MCGSFDRYADRFYVDLTLCLSPYRSTHGAKTVNYAKNVDITERAQTIRATTQESWSCSVLSTHTEVTEVSVPVSTTEPEGHAKPKGGCFNPRRADE